MTIDQQRLEEIRKRVGKGGNLEFLLQQLDLATKRVEILREALWIYANTIWTGTDPGTAMKIAQQALQASDDLLPGDEVSD